MLTSAFRQVLVERYRVSPWIVNVVPPGVDLTRFSPGSTADARAELGLDPDFVEAIAFAWFAKRTLQGLPSSAASVTGAKGARVLGGVYAPA